jgi:hypothetical protein
MDRDFATSMDLRYAVRWSWFVGIERDRVLFEKIPLTK